MAEKLHDVIIIGGGIAAHTAALYNARADLAPVVLAGFEPDQLSLTTEVENFPGFPDGVMGPELIEKAKKQAEKFGATYLTETAQQFEINGADFTVTTDQKAYRARTVIVCTGATARRLGIPGEDTYFGRGVSTCAVCDAALYREKTAVVIGGGDSAMEESLALYKFVKKVTIVHRRGEFRASKIMQERVLKLKDKINILLNSEAVEVLGDEKFVTAVKVKNDKTGDITEVPTDGMFLAIGHIANTKMFKGKLKLDKQNYIVTDKRMRTSMPGVYAAGDVQDNIFRQAVTSAGSGCAAAISAERYLEELRASGRY